VNGTAVKKPPLVMFPAVWTATRAAAMEWSGSWSKVTKGGEDKWRRSAKGGG